MLLALLVSEENAPLGENHRYNSVPLVVGNGFVDFVAEDNADAPAGELLVAEQGDNPVVVAASLTEAVPACIKSKGGDETQVGVNECLRVLFFAFGFGDAHGAERMLNGGVPVHPGEFATGAYDGHEDAVSLLMESV